MPERNDAADDAAAVPARTQAKRDAIRGAARELFLRDGFLGTSMDDVAARARVSKQTVYKQFADKQELFEAVVLDEIAASEGHTRTLLEELPDREDFEPAIRAFAREHLVGTLTPSVIALRRTIIGEATRFPDLARTWWEHGPKAGHETLAEIFRRASEVGRLRHLEDPMMAAQHFNWLVLSIPLNQAMFLGDLDRPQEELHAIADEAVRVFLAAYGP